MRVNRCSKTEVEIFLFHLIARAEVQGLRHTPGGQDPQHRVHVGVFKHGFIQRHLQAFPRLNVYLLILRGYKENEAMQTETKTNQITSNNRPNDQKELNFLNL